MADKFLTYAAVAAGAYFLLARGAAPAAAGSTRGNGLALPFPEFAPIEPTDSGSYVAPDVIPQTNGVMCCMAMTPECMACAARNWGGAYRIGGGIVPRPEQPEPVDLGGYWTQMQPAYSYPDYGLRHPYTTMPVPY